MKSQTLPSIRKWHAGLLKLNQLWQRGFYPDDLEKHYFLHWFVFYQGNIIKMSKALRIHRNTIQGHFLKLGYSRKSVKLRHAWQKLLKSSESSFEKIFFIFYHRFALKPHLSFEENKKIIWLWQTQFPYKMLVHHYLLWALRNKKTKTWIQSQLGYSYRHQTRILSRLGKPKSASSYWLSPLKPKPLEIYSERYKSRLKNMHRKN
jgi:hypothetical protein